MACRMQRDSHAPNTQGLFKIQRLKGGLFAQSRLKYRQPSGRAQHLTVTGASMIGMGMGQDRPIDRSPRVDEKTALRAVEPLWTQDHQVIHPHGPSKTG
jgi:hypothetical protein